MQHLGLSTCRLDGSTPPKTRQSIVNNFNTGAATRVMLLSSKAGGTGLNLIGASRLVLYDIDWNPATDLQAMARIWRDGQRRPCHVVRVCLEFALTPSTFNISSTAWSPPPPSRRRFCSGR